MRWVVSVMVRTRKAMFRAQVGRRGRREKRRGSGSGGPLIGGRVASSDADRMNLK